MQRVFQWKYKLRDIFLRLNLSKKGSIRNRQQSFRISIKFSTAFLFRDAVAFWWGSASLHQTSKENKRKEERKKRNHPTINFRLSLEYPASSGFSRPDATVASGLEKPLLAGYIAGTAFSETFTINFQTFEIPCATTSHRRPAIKHTKNFPVKAL